MATKMRRGLAGTVAAALLALSAWTYLKNDSLLSADVRRGNDLQSVIGNYGSGRLETVAGLKEFEAIVREYHSFLEQHPDLQGNISKPALRNGLLGVGYTFLFTVPAALLSFYAIFGQRPFKKDK